MIPWAVVVAGVSFIAGAVFVAVFRSAREADLAAALEPACSHCRDTGAHVTNEIRPRLQFCNLCPLGQMYEQQATARVDRARAALRSIDRPDGA